MLTKQDVIRAIRRNHLKANIDEFERDPRRFGHPQWLKAWIDGGLTWIYLHVPIKGGEWDGTAQRVYPPAALRRKLAAVWWQQQFREALEKIAANGVHGSAWLVAVAREALGKIDMKSAPPPEA